MKASDVILSKAVMLFLLLLCTACADAANPGAMTAPVTSATMLQDESRLRQAIQVGTIGGGRETNPLWTSQVSGADFRDALSRSLAVHAMLATSGGKFRLDATLMELKQPLVGFDMTVGANVLYRLTSESTGRVVFEKVIANNFTAAFSSSFVGVQRLRLANEGAIRENIANFTAALVDEERTNGAGFRPVVAELLPQLRSLTGS